MKKALIIWGGWEGHHPEETAETLAKELTEKRNFLCTVTSNFGVLLSGNLHTFDVIIPIWSCGIKSDYYLNELLDAIKSGVGLATFHGGINWFEDEKYYQMIGGFYLYDTPPEKYQVNIHPNLPQITKEHRDFDILSEKYYLQTDPSNQVLATANYSELEMPITWARFYEKGRVFYTSLAHTVEEIFSEPSLEILLNGIEWCAGKDN